jgi:hypothetical protein
MLILEGFGLMVLAIIVAMVFAYVSPTQQFASASRNTSLESGTSELSPFLSVYRSDATFPGFTLYPQEGTAEVQLLNMKGQIVHKWNVDAERARLLPNGNLLVIHGSKWGRTKKKWKNLRDTVIEYDWDGKEVWRHTTSEALHHDTWRLENGNTLLLKKTSLSPALQGQIRDSARKAQKIRSDSVLEVDKSGKIVWRWDAHEHLDINECGKRGCGYLSGRAGASDKGGDWTHINTAVLIPENRWFKNGDERFRPGNLMVLPRNWWTALVIDRASGEIVWKYEGDYKGGLGGGHEAHMIPEDLPGAGNILIFDNGASVHPDQSFILEIQPLTKEVVWVYEAPGFYSATRGSAQRLPNGNTLISEDVTGRTFEVTPDKTIAWSYKGPKPTNRSRRYPVNAAPQLSGLPLD